MYSRSLLVTVKPLGPAWIRTGARLLLHIVASSRGPRGLTVSLDLAGIVRTTYGFVTILGSWSARNGSALHKRDAPLVRNSRPALPDEGTKSKRDGPSVGSSGMDAASIVAPSTIVTNPKAVEIMWAAPRSTWSRNRVATRTGHAAIKP